MKAVAYIRRSKPGADTAKRTGKDVHSLATQEDWCRRAASDDGFDLIEAYSDEGSGKDLSKRRALKRLIQDIAAGKMGIQRVYVHAVDRLSRNVKYMTTIVSFLRAYDVTLVFGDLRETAGTNAELVLVILAGIAEMTLKEITRKSEAGQEHAKQEGKLVGRPPSGHRISKDGKSWKPLPWLREAAKLRAAGCSLFCELHCCQTQYE